jgi:hypothetical protein
MMTTEESQLDIQLASERPKSPSIAGSLLDEVDGPIVAEQLPRALDRLEIVLMEFLDAMPEFDGGSPFVEQLGTEMAGVRDAAREMCRRVGIPWKSRLEEQRWLELLGFGKSRAR